MDEGRVAVIVLAAGLSRRYGAEDKLWQPFDGRPLIQHTLETLTCAKPDTIDPRSRFIVLQPNSAEGRTISAAHGFFVVDNPLFENGMGTSIAAGVAHLGPAIAAAFIVLGDMPRVRAETYRDLRNAWRADPSCNAYVPVVDGRRGNPVLFARSAFPALQSLSADRGARTLIDIGTLHARNVPCDDPAIFFDVDTKSASTTS